NQKRTIDIISGKLATECTPELAKKEETGGSAAQHSGDTFVTGNSDEEDDIHECTDVRPKISNVAVSLSSTNSYMLDATVTQGTHPLSGNGDKGGGKVEFFVDGQSVGTANIGGTAASILYTPSGGGTH